MGRYDSQQPWMPFRLLFGEHHSKRNIVTKSRKYGERYFEKQTGIISDYLTYKL